MAVRPATPSFILRAFPLTPAPLGLVAPTIPPMAFPFRLIPTHLQLPCAPFHLAGPALPLAGPSLPPVRMNDSTPPPPLDDDAAPIVEMVAPSSDDASPIQVTRELLTEFLAKTATQDRIREVVLARVPKGTSPADVNDIVQQANGRALHTKALPDSVPGMRPWVSRVAVNAVFDQSRLKTKDAKVSSHPVQLDDLPA